LDGRGITTTKTAARDALRGARLRQVAPVRRQDELPAVVGLPPRVARAANLRDGARPRGRRERLLHAARAGDLPARDPRHAVARDAERRRPRALPPERAGARAGPARL